MDPPASRTGLLEDLLALAADAAQRAWELAVGLSRGPAHDRRAALAAGPGVWEVIALLQELDGTEEQRISLLSTESDLHPRLIRIALDHAAESPVEVQERINRNRAMTERSRKMSQQRAALLA